jgi:hypothetical protein
MWILGGGHRHRNDAPSSQGSGRPASEAMEALTHLVSTHQLVSTQNLVFTHHLVSAHYLVFIHYLVSTHYLVSAHHLVSAHYLVFTHHLVSTWAGLCSSAYVLRAESCQGTCGRSIPKTCPLSCIPASAARLSRSIGYSICSRSLWYTSWWVI